VKSVVFGVSYFCREYLYWFAAMFCALGNPLPMLTDLLEESRPPDSGLEDVIVLAFLEKRIDDATLSLAYSWLKVNHPGEQ